MKKTILTFGLISGLLSSLMMVATVPFMHRISFDKGYVVGYTAIVLSFLLVFLGVRSYRDHAGNGFPQAAPLRAGFGFQVVPGIAPSPNMPVIIAA